MILQSAILPHSKHIKSFCNLKMVDHATNDSPDSDMTLAVPHDRQARTGESVKSRNRGTLTRTPEPDKSGGRARAGRMRGGRWGNYD